ncbi:hypothetical protein NFI96_012202, partial [Prochilodus magdalenae]
LHQTIQTVHEFLESSLVLRRRKREWVIPPISFPENDRGPFPKRMVQIKSSYVKETKITYSITGEGADQPPAGFFTINKLNGMLYVTKPLDRETKDKYTLQAHAVSPEVKEDPMEIIVNVIDMNDNKPVFTQDPFIGSVPEASPIGFEFMTVTATDADDPETYNADIRYTIVSQTPQTPNPNMFVINPVTGAIRVNSEGLDREKDSEYTVEIQAADMQGNGLVSMGKAVITVTDSNDNAPRFEKNQYSVTVPENKVGVVVVKMPVTDGDEPQSPAWTARFRIVSGNRDGFFSVSTGPNKQEGIVTTVKPLDFEENNKYTLLVVAENNVPFAKPLTTSTATVIVNAVDVNDAPVFDPKEKIISKPEDLPINSTLTAYTATDPDTARTQRITYRVGADPAGWLSVDTETGLVKVRSPMDRESPFVKEGRYTALILAMDDDQVPATGTGTLVIEVKDVNDNAPTINEKMIRVCNKQSAPVLLSVMDRDGPGFAAPYQVELQGESRNIWSAMMNEKKTGIILQLQTALNQGDYNIVLRVYDNMNLYQDSTVLATVCDCTGDRVHCPPLKIYYFCRAQEQEGISKQSKQPDKQAKFAEGGAIPVSQGTVDRLLTRLICEGLLYVRHHLNQMAETEMEHRQGQHSSDEEDFFSSMKSRRNGSSTRTALGNTLVSLRVVQNYHNGTEKERSWAELVTAVNQPELHQTIQTVHEFPESSLVLRRRKREWVIPPISFPENYKGPFPKRMVQIKSSYVWETKITYSITGEGADQPPVGLFTINNLNGMLYVTKPLDRETKDKYTLQAHAISPEVKEDPMEIIVNVIDMNDNKPVFTQDPFIGSVPEASPIGFEFMTVTATDADDPETDNADVRYTTVSQTPQTPNPNMFVINPVTGAIRVNSEGLDREKDSEYTLEIQAADMQGNGLVSMGKAVITVTDSNDNAPRFEKNQYSVTVPENKVGVVVVKMPVTDEDEPQSPAWTARFRIVSGNRDGCFNVSTGPNKQEGIVTTVKPLDFEENNKYTLWGGVGGFFFFFLAENNVPFAKPLRTSTATVIVNAVDVNDAPVFDPKEKIISKPEDLPINSTLTAYTATDPNTMKTQRVTYRVGADPAGWLSVDTETGLVKVRSPMDRESPFVKEGRYTALILAMDDDQVPATGTGTLVIEVKDVNDNAPTINEKMIRVCNKQSAPVLLSVMDRDGSGFAAPYQVELQGESRNNWSAMMNEKNWGSTQDLTSWRINDPKKGLLYVRHHLNQMAETEMEHRQGQHSSDEEDFFSSMKSRRNGSSTRTALGNTLVSLHVIQNYHNGTEKERSWAELVTAVNQPDLTCSTTEAHISALLHTFTADQVRGELRRLHIRKAAGPDRVCPRLLKSCPAEIFILSRPLGRVPTLWKTSCLVPVPKKGRPNELNDFRPVALTSHVMKTLERLLLHLLRPQVQHAMDPAVRLHALNTIQPLQLRDKLARMQVDPNLISWITDYLTDRPQYVRLKDCTSDTVVSSTGAPQGTVLSPFLFTLYTSDLRNNLLLNTSKTKELVVDFRRARPLTQPVSIEGVEVEMVKTYRYLGLHLDERLDWSANTDILYRKGQSRLYFLWRLGSFNICRKLLQMFYQTVVSSCIFYAVVCWGGSIKKRDKMCLDKLVKRAGSVVGVELDSVVKVAERRTLHKLLSIMDDDGHPLHTIIMDRRSKFSGRLLSHSCSTDRLRRSFTNGTESSSWPKYKGPESEEAAVAAAELHQTIQTVHEFPEFSLVLRRRKREWVIPPISFPENDRGPFPKRMVQIKSSYGKDTKITYSITGEGADQPPVGLFTINKLDGTLFVTKPLDRETKDKYTLQAHAVSPELKEDPIEIIVNVTDMNDNKPVFTQDPFIGSVPEASPIGRFEFMTVTATDADDPETDSADVRYTITSQTPQTPNPYMFIINPVTGAIRVNSEGLDREKDSEYTLEIQAADMQGNGLVSMGKAVITVTDSNDNAPRFEKNQYSVTVPENKVGAVVVKMPVTDGDEPQSPAWTARFRIVSGNRDGFFSVSTGPNKQEGIVTTVKPLDFEENNKYTLLVVAENNVPFAKPLTTSTATVIVNAVDVNDAPVFDPKEKIISKPEDLPINSTLTAYTATDPDTARTQRITYRVGADPAGWLSVDAETGLVKVRSPMDRESPFVKEGRYTALILAMDDDQVPATGTGTLVIMVKDVNDNAPTINEKMIRVCNKQSAPVLLSVMDRDGPSFTAPYQVEIQGESRNIWSAMMNEKKTGIILQLQTTLNQGDYNIVLRVYDNMNLYQDSTVLATVCDCTGDRVHCPPWGNYFCIKV